MWHLLRKELLHMIRDTGLVIFILYAFTLDIYMAAKGFNLIPEMISISVHDEDNSPASRELTDRLRPPAFRTPRMISSPEETDRLLNASDTVLVLNIPAGFQRDVYRQGATVQVLVDGTQSTAAYLSSAYLGAVIDRYSAERLRAAGRGLQGAGGLPYVDIKSRVYFNPSVRDDIFEGLNEFFLVVTLIGMILPAAVLIREIEYGTIEQILISPFSVRKLLMVKVIASSAFLLAMIGLSYEFVLRLWLGFPLKGTVAGFLFISLVYGLATTGLSFIIASIARRFSQIGMLTIVFFAPMLLLSGGWVPPEALPEWLRAVTFVSPLKYYMELGIGLLIRGAGMELLLPSMLKLSALAALLMGAGYGLYNHRILKGVS